MLCFGRPADEPACGAARHVWVEPGDSESGDVLTVLCDKHADLARSQGAEVMLLRSARAAEAKRLAEQRVPPGRGKRG